MATIQKVSNKNGTVSYRAIIRLKGTKPVSKTFRTKRLAQQYARRLEGDRELLAATGSNPVRGMCLYDLIAEYLTQYTKKDKIILYRLAWWSAHYGHLMLDTVDAGVIRKGLANLEESGRQSPTLNRYRTNLSSVFRYGKEKYNLKTNPCLEVEPGSENKGRVRYLSLEEKAALLQACKESSWPRLYLLVLMAITTGARKGELLGLTWADIDFTHNLAALHDTKSGKPRRLPLTDQVLGELKQFREVGSVLLFPSEIIPTKPLEFRKHWHKALTTAGITDYKFHDNRHTCASYLAQNGATLLEIANVLGHSQIAVTQRYAHLCVSQKQQLINSVLGEIGL